MTSPSRLRRVATGIALAVGAFAVIATSGPRTNIGNTVEGSLQLSPDAPVVDVEFAFEANAAALDEGSALLALEWHAFWSGVPSGAALELTPEIVKIAGPGFSAYTGFFESRFGDLDCGGPECLGTYLAKFRWPSDLDAGTVRIEWTVSGNVSYNSADPPDGASAHVVVERPAEAQAPVRIFDEQIRLSRGRSVVMHTLRVQSEAGIPQGTALTVEVGDVQANFGHGGVFVTLLQDEKSPQRLRPSTSTALDAPAGCRNAPCSFSFSLVTEFRISEKFAYADAAFNWGVTSQGVSAPIDVTREQRAMPMLTGRISLGRVHLENESGNQLYHVTIRLPAAALPRSEFGGLEPIIQAQLSFNAVQESLDFPDEGQLYLRFSFPTAAAGVDASFEDYRYHNNFDEGLPEYPETFVVPNRCESEVPCVADLMIEFATTGRTGRDEQFQGLIELDPTLDITVAYPVTGVVPAGADLEVVLEPGA